MFLDLRKAYDSVNREKLWRILEERASSGAEQHIVALLRRMYSANRVWKGE